MTPSDVMRNAAEYLETHGWMTGVSGVMDTQPQRCAVGALYAGMGVSFLDRCGHPNKDAVQAAHSHLDAVLMTPDGGAATWNDQPERTAEEVIAKLREVADALEADRGE
jgi:hypothetical protein